MNSSSDPRAHGATVTASAGWAPPLDLTPSGLSQFDPARVDAAIARGYEDGLRAGRDAALADETARIDALLDEFRDAAARLLGQIAEVGDGLARAEAATAERFGATVVDVAVQLAESIVGHELSDPTIAAVNALSRVVDDLGRRDHVWVQLHPEDIELLGGIDIPETVTIEANRGLRRGDATGRTDDRTIDARIATALERARASLDGRA